MKYLVIYEGTGTGFRAYVPDLAGCITTGPTMEETQRLIQEAIEFNIEGLREDGLSILSLLLPRRTLKRGQCLLRKT